MGVHVDTLSLLMQPQPQLTLKQKTPETARKLNCMKFDNRRFLDAILIQMDRRQRGRDVEPRSWGKEDAVWHGEAVAAEWADPHSSVVNKNWEGYLGKE